MLEFLFVVSGQIAAAIQELSNADSGGAAVVSLIGLGGLIASVSPSGLVGALAALGQLQAAGTRPARHSGTTIAAVFSLGMVAALAPVGLLAGWAGQSIIGAGLTKWLPLLTLLMGLNLLGVLRWKRLGALEPRISPAPSTMVAFWLGIPFGLAVAPCTLPVLITVLTVAAASGSALFGLVGLVAFGLGRSVPVLLLSLFSDQARGLPRIHQAVPYLRQAAGSLITVVSVYFLTLGRDLLG